MTPGTLLAEVVGEGPHEEGTFMPKMQRRQNWAVLGEEHAKCEGGSGNESESRKMAGRGKRQQAKTEREAETDHTAHQPNTGLRKSWEGMAAAVQWKEVSCLRILNKKAT